MNRSGENTDKLVIETPPQDEFSQYSDTESDSERDSSGSDSSSSTGSESSSQSIEAEWARFIEEDGSLTYLESYVSSTVKERQVHQAFKAASEFEQRTHFPSPQKNIKRQTKLLNLLKRRPSVRIKSSIPASGNAAKTLGGGNQEQAYPPPKVTFRDNPSGEVRHVILRVVQVGSNFGRRATFCETVLGILPGRFNEPPDSRVMVAGLAPGSQALKDGSIKIGDWLKELNGQEVNWDNLDSILLDVRIPSTVTLSVQKCAVETLPHDDHHNLRRITQTRLAKFVSGKERKSNEWSAMVERGALPLHTVLHLSLSGVTEESPDRSDVRYQFPSMNNKLVQVRGMFLTLCHSLQDIVGAPVVGSTVTLHGVHYHSAFCREENDILLMVLPHFCISDVEIVSLMKQVCKLIKFEFGTLSSGLLDPGNKDYLDHLFLMTLEDLLMLEEGCGVTNAPQGGSAVPSYTPAVPPFTDYALSKTRLMFGAPTLLLLRDDFAKSQLEICLNELQSGDFGDNDSDCEDCVLFYNIIGCSIFYKGHLLLSHLDVNSSECVFLFLERHRLLQLVAREPVSQLVLWKRVFPTCHPEGECHPPSLERKVNHYLLVVAMNHFLLATLVESGNITELMDQNAGPDPFLVDQAETTLYHLHSLHVHTACEESLAGSTIDIIHFLDARGGASVSRKSSKGKISHDTEGSQTRPTDVPSILKQKSPSPFDPCECERSPGEGSDDSPHSHSPCPPNESPTPEGEGDEGDSFRGDETSSDSDWRVWKGSDSKTGSPQNHGVSFNTRNQPQAPIRVTVGEENVLLRLVQLDVGEGVLVTSHSDETVPPLHAQLLRNFHAAVAHIQHVLHTGNRHKEPAGSYSGSNCLNSTKEYGIMFEYQVPTKSKTQEVAYWVVGRVYGSPYEREIYVALEDSIAQNMQEIAFKLALGCS